MKTTILFLSLLCLTLNCAASKTADFWEIRTLQESPQVEWGSMQGVAQEVFYSSVPYEGRPTRIFAYIARPKTGNAPLPAMVLVHGGAGKAYREWAELWARKGFVAIAMDLTGKGPEGQRLADAGPEMSQKNIFLMTDNNAEMKSGWLYHAVAAVIKARSILAEMPEVDQDRVGISGISWGGVVTCIAAGLDHRYGVAVPVYGCGFLYRDGFWENTFQQMDPAHCSRWVSLLDPSNFLPGVQCPILFVNGNSDTHFPPENTSRSALLVEETKRHLVFVDQLRHGHNWKIPEVDAFVVSVLNGGNHAIRFSALEITGSEVSASIEGDHNGSNAVLFYALKSTPWRDRKWSQLPASAGSRRLRATLPIDRDVIFYFSVKNDDGLGFTSPSGIMK